MSVTLLCVARGEFDPHISDQLNNFIECLLDFCSTYVRLPKPFGAGGPRIQLTDYSKFDPKVFKLIDLFRYQMLLMERQLREDDNSIVSGYIEILDLSKMSISFLAQMDFPLFKKMGVFAEKAAPTRLKGVHMVNCPKEAATVLNMAKSLMPSKLQQRVSTVKSSESLWLYKGKLDHKVAAAKHLFNNHPKLFD